MSIWTENIIAKFHQKIQSGFLQICKIRQGITFLPHPVDSLQSLDEKYCQTALWALTRHDIAYTTQRQPLVTPATGHVPTRLPFNFSGHLSRMNSDIRLHVVAYPVKITLLVSCRPRTKSWRRHWRHHSLQPLQKNNCITKFSDV